MAAVRAREYSGNPLWVCVYIVDPHSSGACRLHDIVKDISEANDSTKIQSSSSNYYINHRIIMSNKNEVII